MSSTTSTRRPCTVAWFQEYDQVRSAEVELERNGIDPVNVRISTPDTTADRRAIDRRSMGWIGRRALIGAIIGAALGAAIGTAIGAALNGWTSDVVFFTVGGLIFGTPPGFFYAVGTRLPASPEAFDTFGDEEPGAAWIAVTGPSEVRDEAAQVLEGLQPLKLQRVDS